MNKLLLSLFFAAITQQSMAQAPRKVLIEEFTGTWCGNCPQAIIPLDDLNTNPNFIVIANHGPHSSGTYGDHLACLYSEQVCAFDSIGSYPAAAIDRYDWNYNGNFGSVIPATLPAILWGDYANRRLAITSPVSIDLITSYDSSSHIVTVTINANFVGSASGDLRIVCALTEDSVTGSTLVQENYFGRNCSHPDSTEIPFWYNYPCSIPSVPGGFCFNHVARTCIPAGYTLGISGIIPSSVTDGEHYTQTYTDTLQAGWNSNNMKVVAYITRFSGHYYQNEILNAQEVTLGQSITGVVENPSAINNVSIDAAYPNPFSQITSIKVNIPATQHVSAKVHDISGHEVATLADENLSPGVHTFYWNGNSTDGSSLANGLYLIRLQTEKQSLSKTVVLSRN